VGGQGVMDCQVKVEGPPEGKKEWGLCHQLIKRGREGEGEENSGGKGGREVKLKMQGNVSILRSLDGQI